MSRITEGVGNGRRLASLPMRGAEIMAARSVSG